MGFGLYPIVIFILSLLSILFALLAISVRQNNPSKQKNITITSAACGIISFILFFVPFIILIDMTGVIIPAILLSAIFIFISIIFAVYAKKNNNKENSTLFYGISLSLGTILVICVISIFVLTSNGYNFSGLMHGFIKDYPLDDPYYNNDYNPNEVTTEATPYNDSIGYYENGNISYIIVYYPDGSVQERTDYNRDGFIEYYVKFTPDGKCIREIMYDDFGQIEQDCIFEHYDNGAYNEKAYDANGNLIYNKNYNSDGRISEERHYDENGELISYRTYSYSEDGSSVETEYYSNGTVKKVTTRYPDGSLKTHTDFYENGRINWSMSWDIYGRTTFDEYHFTNGQSQTIEYFYSGSSDQYDYCIARDYDALGRLTNERIEYPE